MVQLEKLVQMALISESGRHGGFSGRRAGSEQGPGQTQAVDKLKGMWRKSRFFLEQTQKMPGTVASLHR